MKFNVQTNALDKKQTDCLVIGVYEDGELSAAGKKIDKSSQGHISKILKSGEMEGKPAETLLLMQVPGISVPRILLVGLGKQEPCSPLQFRRIITQCLRSLLETKTARVTLLLADIHVEKRDLHWKINQIVLITSDLLYQFQQYKSKPAPRRALKEMTLDIAKTSQLAEAKKALAQAHAMASGMELTKNIANQPSNICTPTYLADQAVKLAKSYRSIKATVLNEKDMKKLGMGALLAVAKGSAEEAKFVSLEYKGSSKKQAPIALVGKGITFDTGGISLKPAESMVGMKYDMCGAATVIGTLKAAAELKLPIHIVGILAVAENMPGGSATKPEDIVTTLSGQTVEILNTDAEGRLVLSDALTYCERFKPQAVIDIATLTGAVVIALGQHATGLLSNNQPLANELIAAGNETHDRAWQMPLWEDYQDQLKSPFADMTNVGGRAGGTITAACFLSRFAKKFNWAHLDVAGTAAMMMGGTERYATGRPVPLLTQYLINKCN